MTNPNEPINPPASDARQEVHRRWIENGELPTEWMLPGSAHPPVPFARLRLDDLHRAAEFLDREPARAIQNLWQPWVLALYMHVMRESGREVPHSDSTKILATFRRIMARAGTTPEQDAKRLALRVTQRLDQARRLRVEARKSLEEADRTERAALCDAQALSALLAGTPAAASA